MIAKYKLDAIVSITNGPACLIDLVNGDYDTGGCSTPAAVAGYPHVTVQADFFRGLPLGLSFFGPRRARLSCCGWRMPTNNPPKPAASQSSSRASRTLSNLVAETMTRREILTLGSGYCFLPNRSLALSADAPEPIPEPHFPSRLYEFIWRNWELANADRIAKVLRTTDAVVLEIGASVGPSEKATAYRRSTGEALHHRHPAELACLARRADRRASRMDSRPVSIHPEGRRLPRHQAGYAQTAMQRTSVSSAVRGGKGARPRDPRHGTRVVWRFHQPAGAKSSSIS